MSLAQDLLEQARWLAKREPKRPRQASLRRAVSAAYYALFHLLGSEVAGRFAPTNRERLGGHFRRALSHGTMKEVAAHVRQSVLKGTPASHVMAGVTVSSELGDVAVAFVDLQQARHDADYNVERQFTRTEVADLIKATENAFAKWQIVRKSPEADAFLAALLLWKQAR